MALHPLGGTFKENEIRIPIKWKALLKRETFEKGDIGFWGIRYWIKWIDTEGREQTTITDGDIHLIVVDPKYVSLHSIESDDSYVWDFISNGVNVKMTTGGRTYVKKK